MGNSVRDSALKRLFQRKAAIVASITLATIAVLAILSPWVIADPNAIVGTDRLLPPSEIYWFGTDNFGRDNFARVVVGAKSSMFVGAVTALVATAIGTFVAILSSMFSKLDLVLMRLVDGIMGFPILVLALSMLAILGPGIQTVVLCLIIVMFPGVTRIVRSTALVIAESPMIESAKAVGASNLRIMRKYILPACVTPILIQAAIIFTVAIIVESGLSFIGAGLPPEVPSWGDSLATARNYLDTAWWLWLFPGAALVAVVLSVNLIVDALRDIFDPRESVK